MNESSNGVNSIIERYIQRCIFFGAFGTKVSEAKGKEIRHMKSKIIAMI